MWKIVKTDTGEAISEYSGTRLLYDNSDPWLFSREADALFVLQYTDYDTGTSWFLEPHHIEEVK